MNTIYKQIRDSNFFEVNQTPNDWDAYISYIEARVTKYTGCLDWKPINRTNWLLLEPITIVSLEYEDMNMKIFSGLVQMDKGVH